MISALAQAQPVAFISFYKPLLIFLTVGFWAWLVSLFDKDLQRLHLPRQLWNLVHIVAGGTGIFLWLFIPFFWVGLILALILLFGPVAGYAVYRNSRVAPAQRWRLSLEMLKRKVEGVQVAQAQRAATVRLLRPDGSRIPVPGPQEPFAAAHAHLEELLEFALPRKGDRIDLIIGANKQLTTLVHVDGVKIPQTLPSFDAAAAISLIDYVKTHAGLNVEDRRKKQQGVLHFDAGPHGRHVMMVTTIGSTRELVLTLRIDPDIRSSVGLAKLGLLDTQRQQLEAVLRGQGQVILVSAPPGHGQTTTLYSLLREHDPYMHSVVTLEDEIAFEMEGVNHHLIESGQDGPAVAQRLALLIRQDPQVIMVSRLADPQIARLAAQHGREIRFYLGLRQEDTFSALKLYVKAVGDPKLAARTLGAILAQRLVRKLCLTCRTPYKPDPEALHKLNLPADKVTTLYKQSGQVLIKNRPEPCPQCLGLAYRGRTGVFEVMCFDDQARQLLASGQLDQLRAHLRKNRMLWLQEAALAKVVDGTTSISEITRALGAKST